MCYTLLSCWIVVHSQRVTNIVTHFPDNFQDLKTQFVPVLHLVVLHLKFNICSDNRNNMLHLILENIQNWATRRTKLKYYSFVLRC